MTVSSTRNRLAISAAGLGICAASLGAPSIWPDFRLELNSRLAYHTFAPKDLASHRHTLEIEQKLKWKDWQFVAGAQGYAETAFAANPRYSDELAKSESQEVVLRDVYIQYKSPSWMIRAGNQQVVWGEAFGFYFADVINPKDTRDFGLGDLSKQRISVPMLNVKWIQPGGSLQAIFIPKPYFNKNPALGTDFGNVYPSLFPGAALSVKDDRSLPIAPQNAEVGIRAATQVRKVDFSLFYFHYHDRSPVYSVNPVNLSPLEIELQGSHPRIHTAGVSAVADLSDFVVRVEAVHTLDRYFPRSEAGVYENFRSNESVGVLGVEYTRIQNWRVGAQVSDAYLHTVLPGSLYSRNRPLVTLLANGPLYRDHSIDVLFSLVPNDGSTLTQVRYLFPVASTIELYLGADFLLGGNRSQFGQFHDASRGYVLLKAYFSG